MPISTAFIPLCAGVAGSLVYLMAGGRLFWSAVIFIVALMPAEEETSPAP